jgi:hypothetical protein
VQLEPLLAPGTRIYAPAAFADQADHALVRRAALQLWTAGFAVSLYPISRMQRPAVGRLG